MLDLSVLQSDEVKKQQHDNYMKIKAQIKFEAVGIAGTTHQELKILYF